MTCRCCQFADPSVEIGRAIVNRNPRAVGSAKERSSERSSSDGQYCADLLQGLQVSANLVSAASAVSLVVKTCARFLPRNPREARCLLRLDD